MSYMYLGKPTGEKEVISNVQVGERGKRKGVRSMKEQERGRTCVDSETANGGRTTDVGTGDDLEV